jgi:DNA-binding HxlR family transcriptional regulator
VRTRTNIPPPPGSQVSGSSTSRPLMKALDLLGRRWALRILWELRVRPLGARSLRAQCDDMSSSVLYERLGDLVEAGLVLQNEERDYELTALGREVGDAIEPLSKWAERWAAARSITPILAGSDEPDALP